MVSRPLVPLSPSAAYINGVARQPEAAGLLRPIAILGFALAEALAIFGLVLFFL